MNGSIPDVDTCIRLLKKYGCSKEVITHCMVVRDVALKISEYVNVDKKLVEAGALLHDIGRGTTHGIRHAVEGARIAYDIGLSYKLVFIIERHIGAGIPAEEAERLKLPKKDYLPITLEEKIIAHADNLVDGEVRQSIHDEVDAAVRKGLKNTAARLVALHKELIDLCGIDLDNI